MSEDKTARTSPERPWKPTPEFFLSDPRSKELREVSGEILQRLGSLLYDPEIAENKDEQIRIYSELERYNGHLIELGIRPGMNTGEPLEFYKASPVKTAEYLAGQLVEVIGENFISTSDIGPMLDEANLIPGNRGAGLVDLKHSNPKILDFMVMNSIVRTVRGMFAFESKIDSNSPQE